jgi:hypothetical protein
VTPQVRRTDRPPRRCQHKTSSVVSLPQRADLAERHDLKESRVLLWLCCAWPPGGSVSSTASFSHMPGVAEAALVHVEVGSGLESSLVGGVKRVPLRPVRRLRSAVGTPVGTKVRDRWGLSLPPCGLPTLGAAGHVHHCGGSRSSGRPRRAMGLTRGMEVKPGAPGRPSAYVPSCGVAPGPGGPPLRAAASRWPCPWGSATMASWPRPSL